jgi:CheY-like chemotaxis protein
MANILIIDGYSAISSLYCEILEEYGHYVFPANSGMEALLVALNKIIEIAVVDDRLPDFDAEEVFTRLKQLQPHVLGILSVSTIFGPAPDAQRWDGLFTKSADYTLLVAEVDRLAGILSSPSHLSSSVMNYDLFSAHDFGSERKTSSVETIVSGLQHNGINLKKSYKYLGSNEKGTIDRHADRSNQDVDEMTNSLMMDLFKKKILEGKQDVQQLKGSWEEASEFVRIHFSKLRRIRVNNQGKLHRLYQDSVAELKKV